MPHRTDFRWLVLVVLTIVSRTAPAAEMQLAGRDLFEKSTGTNVQLSKDGSGVQLAWGELFEDDGPAAGFSYKPNDEKLGKGVAIKKTLVIANPQAQKAMLLLGSSDAFQATINGKPQELQPEGKAGNNWLMYSFPPQALVKGNNEIILQGAGKIWIARDDEYAAGAPAGMQAPNRSAKSSDDGKTWDDKHLGTKGDVDGEYYVRVFLEHFQPKGSLTLPVIDAGNLGDGLISPPLSALGPIHISVNAESTAQSRIVMRARTSGSSTPQAQDWSPWKELSFPAGTIENPTGRYVQISLDLATENPLKSPQIKQVKIEATPKTTSDWTKDVRVVEAENPNIVRTSIPFAYEPFDHPNLKTLRKNHHLDDLVAGTKDELELITRLADWSARQWDKTGHLSKIYPAWDANEILKKYDDGKPVGGFCQQYNLVFLQACESFGLVGRAISLSPGSLAKTKLGGGGHEVVEIWSNQFQKWMYIDGNLAWYTVDEKSGIPLSLWELRDRQLRTFAGEKTPPIRIVKIADVGRWEWDGLDAAKSVPFAELRMHPRSNFMSQTAPLPLNQGMRGWFWTGHHAWTDDLLPVALLYSHRVTRHGDFEWTLNQAHYGLEALATPGEFRVQLDTETPGLATFLARIDDQEAKPVATGFAWTLHPGRNRLEVWPQNIAQRDGIKSWLVLDYQPESRKP